MTLHTPTGWNTWDFRGFNRLVYLDRGRTRIIIEYAIWDEDYRPPHEVKNRGGLHRTFRWTDVTRLGPHAPLGLPARLEFQAADTPFRADAVEQDGTLCLTVSPLAETRLRIVFLLVAPVGAAVRKRRGPAVGAAMDGAQPAPRAAHSAGAGDLAGQADAASSGVFADCTLEFDGATWPHNYFLNVAEPYALGPPGRPVTVRVTVPPTRGKAGAAGTRGVPRGRSAESPGTFAELERTGLAGSGALADAPQAMLQAVTWNTLFDTQRGLVSSAVSRDWCRDWKGVLVFCWDTYLVGAFGSYAAPALARLNFEAVNAAIAEMGHVPNYYMAHGAATRDRSMPPLGAYLIWKTQVAGPDAAWLQRVYPQLARWHRYWRRHRDGNGDGLLEWGSDPAPAYEFPQLRQDNPTLQHSAKCAMYESGLDNSPMYDGVPFNERTHTFELADVALNSYYAMDCEALANMAEFLGRGQDAARHRKEYEAVRARISEHLWDEAHGIYCNRHWDGRFSPRWSPTSFFPLIAGVAPPERAERMIRTHLLNEHEFWGEYVIPSISRSDPGYPDNDYWRGRVWGPFNFLVAEGLRRYRRDEVASELARKSLAMFMQNWRADGGVYENYNAETGRGADVWNAARLYHWGGLLAFVALQELVDVEPAGYLRFGSLRFPAAGLRHAHVGGAVFDVELDDGLRVQRNGQPFLACDRRAIVRIPLQAGPDRPIEISAAGPGRLTWHGASGPPRQAVLNAAKTLSPTGAPPRYTW